jgi:phage-related protein
MKRLIFHGGSLDDLQDFPVEARRAAGFELWQVQCGAMPSDWKPVQNVGAGAYEIRIHVQGEWRVIYVARFEDGIHVLHAFCKKTQQIRKEDIELARKRYQEIGG